MTRRLLSYAFPFMDSFDPLAQAPDTAAIDETLQMDEETFRGFYNRTSGMLWAYVARATSDAVRGRRPAAGGVLSAASQLTTVFESEDHRRNYLFRVATNLIRDRYRRPRIDNAQLPEHGEDDIPAGRGSRQQTQQRSRPAPRDGAAEPPRAAARVARVRTGIDTPGDCRSARSENGKHQAAALPGTQEACENTEAS